MKHLIDDTNHLIHFEVNVEQNSFGYIILPMEWRLVEQFQSVT